MEEDILKMGIAECLNGAEVPNSKMLPKTSLISLITMSTKWDKINIKTIKKDRNATQKVAAEAKSPGADGF